MLDKFVPYMKVPTRNKSWRVGALHSLLSYPDATHQQELLNVWKQRHNQNRTSEALDVQQHLFGIHQRIAPPTFVSYFRISPSILRCKMLFVRWYELRSYQDRQEQAISIQIMARGRIIEHPHPKCIKTVQNNLLCYLSLFVRNFLPTPFKHLSGETPQSSEDEWKPQLTRYLNSSLDANSYKTISAKTEACPLYTFRAMPTPHGRCRSSRRQCCTPLLPWSAASKHQDELVSSCACANSAGKNCVGCKWNTSEWWSCLCILTPRV